MTAHPRSRGENWRAIDSPATGCGSSPLTRGKLICGWVSGNSERLIPAHAGKTSQRNHQRHRGTAHPRSRGENGNKVATAKQPHGSSPLTRGKLPHPICVRLDRRLIPAHAGKTVSVAAVMSPMGAHPRSRGENAENDTGVASMNGSSPLTRGKLGEGRGGPGCRRLIPAHAGKTSPGRGRPRWCAAHPRSRGENDDDHTHIPSVAGSSPLTRGKPHFAPSFTASRRLIPAHAGKTT